jgi:hypothetical protein
MKERKKPMEQWIWPPRSIDLLSDSM